MTIQKAIESLQGAIDGHETRVEIYNLAIAALQAQLNDGWISVEERLPTKSDLDATGRVLAIDFKTLYGLPRYSSILGYSPNRKEVYEYEESMTGAGFYDYNSEYGYCGVNDITHWMPLPQPPKDKQ